MATLTFEADAYGEERRQDPHCHDELHLSMILSGHVAETVSGVTEIGSALSVVVKDSGVVHANVFSAGLRLARLALPDGTIGALVDDPSRSAGWQWKHDARVALPYLRLIGRSKGVNCTFRADDDDLVELCAALTARSAQQPHGEPPAWLGEIMAEIRDCWRADLTVSAIAQRAGVHPVYLARCVRRWYHVGLSEELRRLRLRAAFAALSSAHRTVSDVAHTLGYSDEPHLCREFERRFGMTPGRYRRIVRRLDYNWRGPAKQVSQIQV
jgi:AraC-like DNA-binding protein